MALAPGHDVSLPPDLSLMSELTALRMLVPSSLLPITRLLSF